MTTTPTIDGFYGEAPADLGPMDFPGWQEFMHYLYLPVRIPSRDFEGMPDKANYALMGIPQRLVFLAGVLERVLADAKEFAPHLADPYVYITAKRGWASYGNPLNREGWHADDFGGTDLNYIWSDRYPTRLLTSERPLSMPADDHESMVHMAHLASHAAEVEWSIKCIRDRRHEEVPVSDLLPNVRVRDTEAGHLLRLTPYVIHNTPEVRDEGGMRSFFKISVSTHRYDLIGNSRNHLLDYHWPMRQRGEARNQPQDTTKGTAA